MQLLVIRRSALSSFRQRHLLLLSKRHMSMERIARDLRKEDNIREFSDWNEKAHRNSMQLHPYFQLHDRPASYGRGGSRGPNLAAFTVAAAAAGVVTALFYEAKEEEHSMLGRGIERSRSPYPKVAPPALPTHQPNPLRVRLEYVMAAQERIGTEIEALAKQKRSRETSKKGKELARTLKDLQAEQGALIDEAKRQLLR